MASVEDNLPSTWEIDRILLPVISNKRNSTLGDQIASTEGTLPTTTENEMASSVNPTTESSDLVLDQTNAADPEAEMPMQIQNDDSRYVTVFLQAMAINFSGSFGESKLLRAYCYRYLLNEPALIMSGPF